VHATYPLDRLRMTGYAFAHLDLPEDIPQYLLSELHPGRLSPPAKAAVEVSQSHRVRQTAFWADPILRTFRREDGSMTAASAPP
jgi:hypothetical protein